MQQLQHAAANKQRITKRIAIYACFIVFLVIGVIIYLWTPARQRVQSIMTATTLDRSPGQMQFPNINTSELSPARQRIIQIARSEFTAQADGTKYSQGSHEPWCADFVSWVMNQAGVPLKNPHTGSWRIPGTFTLREYYQAAGRFKPADSGYVPQAGDVAIYRNSPVFGDHTHIVLDYNKGALITVGGNEANRVRVMTNTGKRYEGLLGYGVPE